MSPPSDGRGAPAARLLCGSCRRVRQGDAWLWVPEWAERPPEGARFVRCPPCERHLSDEVGFASGEPR